MSETGETAHYYFEGGITSLVKALNLPTKSFSTNRSRYKNISKGRH